MSTETTTASTGAAIAKQRLMWGLAVAVLVWGLYLAVGAVLFNYDIRKGLIVFSCTLGFLGLWWSVYRVSQQEQTSPGSRGLWNYSSSIGFALSLLASGSMMGAYIQPELAASGTYRMLLAVSLFAGALGAVCTIVGLSSRNRPRGKWMGLVAVVLLLATFLTGFMVSPAG